MKIKTYTHIKLKFAQQFINIKFDDLKKQNSNYLTDDRCIYYLHTINKNVYSWNFEENEWEQPDPDYACELADLFE